MATKKKVSKKTVVKKSVKKDAPIDFNVDYVQEVPRSIPEGKILVHNRVYRGITPKRRIGVNGFRAWFATPNPDRYEVEVCDCCWMPELGKHYRSVDSDTPHPHKKPKKKSARKRKK